jgi:hypothetical protein
MGTHRTVGPKRVNARNEQSVVVVPSRGGVVSAATIGVGTGKPPGRVDDDRPVASLVGDGKHDFGRRFPR